MYKIYCYNSHTAKGGTEIYHKTKFTWFFETLKSLFERDSGNSNQSVIPRGTNCTNTA